MAVGVKVMVNGLVGVTAMVSHGVNAVLVDLSVEKMMVMGKWEARVGAPGKVAGTPQ